MANFFTCDSMSERLLGELLARESLLKLQQPTNIYEQMCAQQNNGLSAWRSRSNFLASTHYNDLLSSLYEQNCQSNLPFWLNNAAPKPPQLAMSHYAPPPSAQRNSQLNRNRYAPYMRSFASQQGRNNYCMDNMRAQQQQTAESSYNSSSYQLQPTIGFACAKNNGKLPNLDLPTTSLSNGNPSASSTGAYNGTVTLQITNLDYNLDESALRSFLMHQLRPITPVVSINFESGSCAKVIVPDSYFAKQVVANLHRKKVGHKRMMVSYTRDSSETEFNTLRCQVAGLLKDVPFSTLPLYKFRELFQARFKTSIGVLELYKMPDICTITGESNEDKYISLQPELMNSLELSPLMADLQQSLPYCAKHFKRDDAKGWAEQDIEPLPNVMMSLAETRQFTYNLLKNHSGDIPIATIVHCLQGELNIEIKPNEHGVNLEHLIACIQGIQIYVNHFGIKVLAWLESTSFNTSENSENASQHASHAGYERHSNFNNSGNSGRFTYADPLHQISREITELLKMWPKATMKFNRFIPAYHNHFGKQCRVADYGYTKLIELFEALTSVVQIMGDGENRQITLTHRTQIRRFTSDLLRVLRAHGSNAITLSELPAVFAHAQSREFDITDYGVCHIEDIIEGLANSNTIVVKDIDQGKDLLISIPKRKQTPTEMEKISVFAAEMIELFRDALQYAIHFQKFVRSYHYHFGYQCRLSDYGFMRLADLLDAIRGIIELDSSGEEDKKLFLSPKVARRVFAEQCEQLMQKAVGSASISVKLELVLELHKKKYGYQMLPQTLGVQDMNAALDLLPYFELNKKEDDDIIWLISHRECASFRKDSYSAALLLLNYEETKNWPNQADDGTEPVPPTIANFINKFNECHEGSNISKTKLKAMRPIIEFAEHDDQTNVRCSNFFKFLLSIACQLSARRMLSLHELKIALDCKLNTTFEFGYPNLYTVIAAYQDLFKLNATSSSCASWEQIDVTLAQDCPLREYALKQSKVTPNGSQVSHDDSNAAAGNSSTDMPLQNITNTKQEVECSRYFENTYNWHKSQYKAQSRFRSFHSNYFNIGGDERTLPAAAYYNKENVHYGAQKRTHNGLFLPPQQLNSANGSQRSNYGATRYGSGRLNSAYYDSNGRGFQTRAANYLPTSSLNAYLPAHNMPLMQTASSVLMPLARTVDNQANVENVHILKPAEPKTDDAVVKPSSLCENPKPDTPPSERILSFWSDPAWLKHSTEINATTSNLN